VQSPYFIFSPSRADFFNLSSNQTANFTAAPGSSLFQSGLLAPVSWLLPGTVPSLVGSLTQISRQ